MEPFAELRSLFGKTRRNGVEAERHGIAAADDDRLFAAAELFGQIVRQIVQVLDRLGDQRIAGLIKVGDGPVTPRTGEHELRNPVLLPGSRAQVHDEIHVFRSPPGRNHGPELPRQFVFGDRAADEGPDSGNPFQAPFRHQQIDCLAQRHIADAGPFGHLTLRRQRRSARVVAEHDFLMDVFTGFRDFIAVSHIVFLSEK